jgi:hypothetical protein
LMNRLVSFRTIFAPKSVEHSHVERAPVKYLFPYLRKSRLKFTIFTKIVAKTTKFMKLNLKVWGCLWLCKAQKHLELVLIVL